MAHIDIRRPHSLEHSKAREAAETVASRLNKEFSLQYQWNGDTLKFHRTGVDGTLSVLDSEVVVSARLGLLLRPLQGRFEHEIHKFLDELFDGSA